MRRSVLELQLVMGLDIDSELILLPLHLSYKEELVSLETIPKI